MPLMDQMRADGRERRASGRVVHGMRALAAFLPAATAALCGAAGSGSAADVMRVSTGRPGTVAFLISGRLDGGELARLQGLVAQVSPGQSMAVILDSPGGSSEEGIRLGTFFHDMRLATFVRGSGGICLGACALAFLGGRDGTTGRPMRVKMSGGRLGFHQLAFKRLDPLARYTRRHYDELVAASQLRTARTVRYLKHIGEDLAKLQLELRAPHQEIYNVTNAESLALGFHVLVESTGELIDAATTGPHARTP